MKPSPMIALLRDPNSCNLSNGHFLSDYFCPLIDLRFSSIENQFPGVPYYASILQPT